MIGNRIRELRSDKKITQEELAKVIGVSTSMVGMYETGARRPSFEVLIKISKYFNVSTDYLLGRVSKKKLNEWDKKFNSNKLAEEVKLLEHDEDMRRIERARNKMTPKDKKR